MNNNQFQVDWQVLKSQLNHTADCYSEADFIAQEAEIRLLDRLSFIKCQPEVILDLGAGVGRSMIALKKQYPEASYYGLDLAFQRCQRLVTHTGRPAITGHFYALPLKTASVDLIIANLSFHTCFELGLLCAELRRILKPNGLLMFSSFGADTLTELRQAFATLDSEPHILPFFDFHHMGDALLKAGFQDPVMDAERLSVHYSSPDKLFQDLRDSGESNSLRNRVRHLYGKSRWQRLLKALKPLETPEGDLPISIELMFGHAFAPSTYSNQAVNGEISIDARHIPIRKK